MKNKKMKSKEEIEEMIKKINEEILKQVKKESLISNLEELEDIELNLNSLETKLKTLQWVLNQNDFLELI